MERQVEVGGEVDVRVRVEIANLRENERLLYPLVLVEGNVVASDDEPAVTFIETGLAPPVHSSDTVTSSTSTPTSTLSWPVVPETGHFKAFVMLPRPGKHEIQLRVRGSLMRVLAIRYARPVTKHFARFHYQQAPNATRGFDAPPGVDNSDDAALQRVRLGALLMQTCIAEMFHKQELPRATIVLEFDDSAECQMPLANLLVTPADSIYDALAEQNALVREDRVTLGHFVHVGSNHYDPETREVPDHRAHMYGSSYLFSAVTLHTWPSSLSELTKCCLDNKQIDPSILSDDSVDRGSYWANFATGFGVFMHLFLRSTRVQDDGDGMFGRGFDNTNRLLSVYEPTYESSEPAFVDLSAREGDEEAGTAPFELNYDVLEAFGDDVEGAYVNETTLLALNEVCPFIKSGSKLTQARKDAAAAA